MPIRVVCPQCGTSGLAPESMVGKKVRCRCCSGPIPVPSAQEAKEEPATPTSWLAAAHTSKSGAQAKEKPGRKKLGLMLAIGPVVWLVVGWLGALGVPWLGLASPWVLAVYFGVAHGVTLAWITWNAYQAVGVLGRTGRIFSVLPLVLVELGLFALLFFQIACHLGTQHFLWENPPGLWDWPGFVLGHAVRAADLFDFLEGYGFHLQTVHAHSLRASGYLVLFHVLFGLFFLGVALEKIEPFTRNLFRQLAGWWVTLFIIFFLTWIVSAEFIRPWKREEMVLWVVDNVLRVVDVADVLEIAQLRLHQVPRHWWEGTLTLVCRLFIGLGLLSLLSIFWLRLRVRQLKGFGVSKETLEDQVDIYSKAVLRQDAEKMLAERASQPPPRKSAWELVSWRARLAMGLLGGGLPVLLGVPVIVGVWEGEVRHLAEETVSGEEPRMGRAQVALERLGLYGEGAVPVLAEGLPRLPPERQDSLLETMGLLGKAGREQLASYLIGPDQRLALQAVAALQNAGSQAAPELIQGTFAYYAPVRKASRKALEELGREAGQALVQKISLENVWYFYPWMDKLYPTWNRQTSANPHFEELCRVKEKDAILANPRSEGLLVHQAALELMKIGRPLALPALPSLQVRLQEGALPHLQVITTEGPVDVYRTLMQAGQQLGPTPSAHVMIVRNALEKLAKPPLPGEVCRKIDPTDPVSLEKVLKELGTQGKSAVPALEKLLADEDQQIVLLALTLLRGSSWWSPDTNTLLALLQRPDPVIQKNAVQTLGQLGKGAIPAIPKLVEVLQEKNPELQVAAAQALGQIGPPAWKAIPALKKSLKDPDPQVRQEALKSLPQIHPQWQLIIEKK